MISAKLVNIYLSCQIFQENIRFAETLGAKVVKLKSNDVADALLKFARENEITHVIFGQSARSRWEIFW